MIVYNLYKVMLCNLILFVVVFFHYFLWYLGDQYCFL